MRDGRLFCDAASSFHVRAACWDELLTQSKDLGCYRGYAILPSEEQLLQISTGGILGWGEKILGDMDCGNDEEI